MKRFFLIGVSHKTAPVEWRERLAVPEERWPRLIRSAAAAGAAEAVVLSTCNRLELYAVAEREDAPAEVRRELSALHGDPALDSCLYTFEEEAAVRHLFRVAAGLDSLVVGESEILGQVKRAYEAARGTRATGKLTNVAFQRAIYVGKLVRTRTDLADGPTSAASLAVALAHRIFGELKDTRALLVGAGQMAEQAARALASQKVARIAVANRTLSRAEELARQFRGGQAVPFDHIPSELALADIVICSTGSPEPVLRREAVAEAMHRRRGKSLFLIDIAVPRDVDPAVHQLENVYLYNIDDLESLVAESLVRRRGEIGRADALVDDKAREFAAWYRAWQQGDAVSLRHSGETDGAPALSGPKA